MANGADFTTTLQAISDWGSMLPEYHAQFQTLLTKRNATGVDNQYYNPSQQPVIGPITGVPNAETSEPGG